MEFDNNSKTFTDIILMWKMFGLWPRHGSDKYYKYFSLCNLFVFLCIYDALLTLNIFYTPRTIENIIHELIYFFNEICVTSKVLMIVFMRETIIKSFIILDSNLFKGCDETSRKIVERHASIYVKCWKFINIYRKMLPFIVLIPLLITQFIYNSKIELPICNYYFLHDEQRDKYFVILYIYQVAGMYLHLVYDFTSGAFMSGMIFLAIGQFKSLNHKLSNLGKSKHFFNSNAYDLRHKVDDTKGMGMLKNCLKHYDLLLE